MKLHMDWSKKTIEAAMEVAFYYSLTKDASGVYAAAKPKSNIISYYKDI
jgi:hypothetical protein